MGDGQILFFVIHAYTDTQLKLLRDTGHKVDPVLKLLRDTGDSVWVAGKFYFLRHTDTHTDTHTIKATERHWPQGGSVKQSNRK
jgi:uncharacterized protein with GYD domain